MTDHSTLDHQASGSASRRTTAPSPVTSAVHVAADETAPGAASTATLADVVCADSDLLRIEFEAIIAANFPPADEQHDRRPPRHSRAPTTDLPRPGHSAGHHAARADPAPVPYARRPDRARERSPPRPAGARGADAGDPTRTAWHSRAPCPDPSTAKGVIDEKGPATLAIVRPVSVTHALPEIRPRPVVSAPSVPGRAPRHQAHTPR